MIPINRFVPLFGRYIHLIFALLFINIGLIFQENNIRIMGQFIDFFGHIIVTYEKIFLIIMAIILSHISLKFMERYRIKANVCLNF